MRDRVFLALYAASVVVLTTIHEVRFLLAALAAVALLAGRDLPRLALHVMRAILLFNGIVSASVLAAGVLRGAVPWGYLALVNLRVATLTLLTFLVFRRIGLARALSFAPPLAWLLTVAQGQILSLRRMLLDLRLALRSRTIGRLGLRTAYRHAAGTGAFFLQRSLASAEEIALAMKSRGLFDD